MRKRVCMVRVVMQVCLVSSLLQNGREVLYAFLNAYVCVYAFIPHFLITSSFPRDSYTLFRYSFSFSQRSGLSMPAKELQVHYS